MSKKFNHLVEPKNSTMKLINLNKNEKFILSFLRRNHRASRVELAKIMGVSNQSLTRLTKSLLDQELIEQQSKVLGSRGQPAINITIKPNKLFAVGVVLANNKLVIRVDDLCGEHIAETTKKVDLSSPTECLSTAKGLLQNMLSSIKIDNKVIGIGISVSGFFVTSNSVCNKYNVEQWSKLNLIDYFEQAFNVPCFMENDGNTSAVGYSISTRGSDLESFFLLNLSENIGGGFVNKQQLLSGQYGNAGEIAGLFSPEETAIRPCLSSLTSYLQHKGTSNWQDALDPSSAYYQHYLEWLKLASSALELPLHYIQVLFDPSAIVLAGELPYYVRKQLVDTLTFKGLFYKETEAKKADLIIDNDPNPLSRGATTLAIYHFLGTTH